jgi:hypothetical protein
VFSSIIQLITDTEHKEKENGCQKYIFEIIQADNRISYRIFLTIFDKVFPITLKSVSNIGAEENKLHRRTPCRS